MNKQTTNKQPSLAELKADIARLEHEREAHDRAARSLSRFRGRWSAAFGLTCGRRLRHGKRSHASVRLNWQPRELRAGGCGDSSQPDVGQPTRTAPT